MLYRVINVITGLITTTTLCQEGRCDCVAKGRCERCSSNEMVNVAQLKPVIYHSAIAATDGVSRDNA